MEHTQNIYRGMKTKTVKAIIQGKINDWLKSIEDEEVRSLAAKNTIVTGGSIASMIRGEPVNDFDLYFRDYKTTRRVAEYYLKRFNPEKKNGIPCRIYLADGYKKNLDNKWSIDPSILTSETPEGRLRIIVKSAGIASEGGTEKPYEYFEGRAEGANGYVSDLMIEEGSDPSDTYEKIEDASQQEDDGPKYRPVFLSTNAITLSHKIQIIVRFYGEPDKIHENYDFVHCTNYWTSWNSALVLKQAALEAILSKELRYVGSKYPICSLIRLRKFIKRGWTINAGQILKMVLQASQLDLTKPEVLEDALTGVDTAYFNQVISALNDKDPNKIDAAYLIEIIDKLF